MRVEGGGEFALEAGGRVLRHAVGAVFAPLGERQLTERVLADAVDVFVRIGAVLDGHAYVYENFTETAKMKASEDVQRVGKCAETMAVCGVPSSQRRIEC